MFSETLAIIDLGTNTFHLLFAEVSERDEYRILEKFKESVRLGEGGIQEGKITRKAYKRGMDALRRFKDIINTKGASKVLAFATSAIRSSSNGEEFVKDAKEKYGIIIKVINGNEEAALIFEGVKAGAHLPYSENCLLMDIGGGSVEFVVAKENKPQLFRSMNLGAARLLEQFQPSDPLSEDDIARIENFLEGQLLGLFNEIREFQPTLLVGSSGSFESIGNMVALQNGDTHSAENLNNYSFSTSSYDTIHIRIIDSNRRERLNIPGMDNSRVDMIPIGAILTNYVLKRLDIPRILISQFALKEGILAHFIEERNKRIRHLLGPTEVNIRAKAIRSLSRKFGCDEKHGLQVSGLATLIFERLSQIHKMGAWESEMLKYASVLHDIGYVINRSGHHKHGQYIINNSNLSGFSYDELVLLGNLVRYHRKSTPTRDHYHFKILPQKDRLVVRTLACILRIADCLDHGHRGIIDNLNFSISDKQISIQIVSPMDVSLEVGYAMKEVHFMKDVFDRNVVISQKGNHK